MQNYTPAQNIAHSHAISRIIEMLHIMFPTHEFEKLILRVNESRASLGSNLKKCMLITTCYMLK